MILVVSLSQNVSMVLYREGITITLFSITTFKLPFSTFPHLEKPWCPHQLSLTGVSSLADSPTSLLDTPSSALPHQLKGWQVLMVFSGNPPALRILKLMSPSLRVCRRDAPSWLLQKVFCGRWAPPPCHANRRVGLWGAMGWNLCSLFSPLVC